MRNSEYIDYEDWEGDFYFFDKQDWLGLEKYRYAQAILHPNDIYYQELLGEAYILNKKYDEAIAVLQMVYQQDPGDINIQHLLLDALFSSEKDETDISWVTQPEIVRLDSNTLDYCVKYLKRKRKSHTVMDLYDYLSCQDWVGKDNCFIHKTY